MKEESVAQKWYQKASVQTAIVSGIFLLVGIAIPYLFKVPNLEDTISDLETANSEKMAEIQRLETLLAPFRTVALERYAGPEGEALRRLGEQIQDLQARDLEKTKRIEELETELRETARTAAPPVLSLVPPEVRRTDAELVCTLRFQSSKNEPLGILQFNAELPKESKAEINDFWPTGFFQSSRNSKIISDDKKSARLTYSLMNAGHPKMELKLSGPSSVRISGNHLREPIVLDVK